MMIVMNATSSSANEGDWDVIVVVIAAALFTGRGG
jgi:hypothetical protein